MKISLENPPNNIRQRCEEAFDLREYKPVFAFGDTIYNPHLGAIDEAMLAHESVHSLQQGEHPNIWWTRYLKDKDFRFEQELQAYRVQYRVTKDMVSDRNKVARALFRMASDLSSPLYGKMCKYHEAYTKIREGI